LQLTGDLRIARFVRCLFDSLAAERGRWAANSSLNRARKASMNTLLRVATSFVLGALVGLALTVLWIWFFVDADMLLVYYAIGIVLGGFAGIAIGLRSARMRRAEPA
jgi:hypothetical protein